jgi:hypothetical protein
MPPLMSSCRDATHTPGLCLAHGPHAATWVPGGHMCPAHVTEKGAARLQIRPGLLEPMTI